jgi:uncharacterized membrane protein
MKEQILQLPDMKQNISSSERIVSLLSGAMLLAGTIRRGGTMKGITAGYLLFRGISGYCPLSDLLDKEKSGEVSISTQLLVHKPHMEVYNFWRRLSNLPLFMRHLESVTELDKKRSHWKARLGGKAGDILPKLDWEAEITQDETGKLIAWHSVEGSEIENSGRVQFADAGDSWTEVYVDINYKAPAGRLGEQVAHWVNPVLEKMIREDINDLRKMLETGEAASMHGRPTIV